VPHLRQVAVTDGIKEGLVEGARVGPISSLRRRRLIHWSKRRERPNADERDNKNEQEGDPNFAKNGPITDWSQHTERPSCRRGTSHVCYVRHAERFDPAKAFASRVTATGNVCGVGATISRLTGRAVATFGALAAQVVPTVETAH